MDERVITVVGPLHAELVLHAGVEKGLSLAAMLDVHFSARLLQAHRILGKRLGACLFDLRNKTKAEGFDKKATSILSLPV